MDRYKTAEALNGTGSVYWLIFALLEYPISASNNGMSIVSLDISKASCSQGHIERGLGLGNLRVDITLLVAKDSRLEARAIVHTNIKVNRRRGIKASCVCLDARERPSQSTRAARRP